MKFSILTDVLFYSAAVWLLSFTIFRYYALPLWLCIAVAVALALATGMTVFLFASGKQSKKLLNKREREAKDALMLHLTLASDTQVLTAFHRAFAADGQPVSLTDGRLELDGKTILPLFTMEATTADSVAACMRKYGSTFVLLCNKLSPEAEKLLQTFEIKSIAGDEVYRLFRETKTTPNPLICGELPRRTLKNKMRVAFSKTNSRPYFVSGSFLLIMSLFTIFPTYYLISGIVLLVCSVLIRFLGYSAA